MYVFQGRLLLHFHNQFEIQNKPQQKIERKSLRENNTQENQTSDKYLNKKEIMIRKQNEKVKYLV